MKTCLAFVLAVSLTVHSTGCSMITLKPLPEDYRPRDAPDCGNPWGLIPDTMFAMYAVAGMTGLFLVGGGCGRSSGADFGPFEAVNPDNPCFGITLLHAAFSALFVGSTVTGLKWAKKCREATDSHEAWLDMEHMKGMVEEEVQ